MAVYVIELPFRRPPMTANDQRRARHWSQVSKAKKEVADVVAWQARSQLPRGLRLNRVSVRVTWYAPDLRKRDSDGLGPFLKAALDALTKDIGLLPDDHSGFVEESSQRILLDRANPRITLEIKDLEAPAPVAPAPVAPAPVAPAPVAPAPVAPAPVAP
ncbi:hypothetical protein AB0H58_32560, partial [Nocardia neocaledoniensis]|uniref:hypothetical protein n=1 Tax=Nocardia neocaledoniensis TaxID=236511 RepID=UPI0033C0BBF1